MILPASLQTAIENHFKTIRRTAIGDLTFKSNQHKHELHRRVRLGVFVQCNATSVGAIHHRSCSLSGWILIGNKKPPPMIFDGAPCFLTGIVSGNMRGKW